MNAVAPGSHHACARRERRFLASLLLAAISAAPLAEASGALGRSAVTGQPSSPSLQREAAARRGRAALFFEPNQGQAPAEVRFLARGGGFLVSLTGDTMIFVNQNTRHPIRLRFAGASRGGRVEPGARIPGISNYLYGADPQGWKTHIPHYASVRIRDVYPGIDLHVYSAEGRLEYDLEVSPGADPSRIGLAWEGIERAVIEDSSGDLIVSSSAGDLRHKRPVVYQLARGKRVPVGAAYRDLGGNRFAFAIDEGWDRQSPLVIDPLLNYSTYLGAAQLDEVTAATSDPTGALYLTGFTRSPNFPLIRPLQGALQGTSDAFVTKLSFDGNFVLYSTFLGGEQEDRALSLAVDADSRVYVAGVTSSYAFPTTPNTALQRAYSGTQDAFLVRLSPNGDQVTYGTFLGDTDTIESGTAVAVDPGGSMIVAGTTTSFGLPVTPGAFQRTFRGVADGFVVKISAAGQLLFCTYLGGAGDDAVNGIALDAGGNVIVAGGTSSADFPTTEGAFDRSTQNSIDGFVLKLSQNGRQLLFSTLLGGPSDDSIFGVAVEPGGRILVAGQAGLGFPTTPEALRSTLGGLADGFVARINTNGTALLTSTLLGTNATEYATRVKPAGAGFLAVSGYTNSNNFPVTSDAFAFSADTSGDVFFSVLQPLGNALQFSSILSGSGSDFVRDLSTDAFGSFYLTGITNSANFQVTANALDTSYGGNGDGFVSKVISVTRDECVGSILPTGTTYQVEGGAGGASIGAGCPWFAFASVSWVTLASNPLSTGAGSLNYQVAANPGAQPRTAAIQAAGNTLQILQKGSTTTVPFEDVPANDPFVDFIRILKNNAITSGCTATNYCPSQNTTRGQMAVFVVRALLLTDDFDFPATPYFNDVAATHPQFKWIQKLRQLGITAGCQALLYCPEDPVTRGQMAAFLVRARFGNSFPFPATPYFQDTPANNTFFPFIQKLRQAGVTTGCTATQYCINDPTTRGQMAVFLTRMFLTPW